MAFGGSTPNVRLARRELQVASVQRAMVVVRAQEHYLARGIQDLICDRCFPPG